MDTLHEVKQILLAFNYTHPEYRLFIAAAVKQPENPTTDSVVIDGYHLPNRANTVSMGCFVGLNAALQAVIDHSQK